MTDTLAAAVVVTFAAGAYLRWGTGPVVIAYEIGRRIERIRARHGHPPAPRRLLP
jgi:hypothetical protein